METGEACDNTRVTKNGLVSSVDRIFKSSDSTSDKELWYKNNVKSQTISDILESDRKQNISSYIPWVTKT